MLIMGSDSWASLRDGMYRKFSSGASVIIQEMGTQVGIILFEASKSSAKADSEPMTPKFLGQTMYRLGCGRYDVSFDPEKGGGNLVFTIKNCVFCEGEKAIEHKCNFVRGLAVGFISKLFGVEYDSAVDCRKNNDEHVCVISLDRQ
jgi:predicted hydrocarbon binding protein